METQKDLSAELDQAYDRLAILTEQVQRNSEILRRSQERELDLLNAENLDALFRKLTAGLARSYDLDIVTVVLLDPDHEVRHLLQEEDPHGQPLPGLVFVEALAGVAPQFVALRKPWLGPYAAADHQLVFPARQTLGSIAMIPLIHRGTLIGSLNFGSADKHRFRPDHATDFFAHLGVIATFCLENMVNRARLIRSGFTDVLTGWHNRRYLQLRLAEELARAQREGGTLVCLMVDIDFFKRVNDRHGHAAGDAVLREIANRVESQVRASDVAARYGGEEFVVLMPNTDVAAGKLLAQRIRHAVSAAPMELGNGHEVTITASIGIAAAAPGADEQNLKTVGESLLARADVALYGAKSAGRDTVAVDYSGAEPAT